MNDSLPTVRVDRVDIGDVEIEEIIVTFRGTGVVVLLVHLRTKWAEAGVIYRDGPEGPGIMLDLCKQESDGTVRSDAKMTLIHLSLTGLSDPIVVHDRGGKWGVKFVVHEGDRNVSDYELLWDREGNPP